MNLDLTEEALEYGRMARRALESAGGDDLVVAIEDNPGDRGKVVVPALAEIGAWDLDPRGSPDELEASAALCRSVGYWAVAYPVAERLARPADIEADGLVVVADVNPQAPIADLDLRWVAVGASGQRSRAVARPLTVPPRKSAFVTELDLHSLDGDGARDLALGLVLPCWTLLGMLDRAMDLTKAYVLERQQFNQPLASFQGVQFQLTDAEVERVGMEELAKYALWSIEAGNDEAVDDALALRVAAIDAAAIVFRVCHQLHGAIGFCDETTLSWISRYSLPIRRLPFGLTHTRALLAARIGRTGLTGPFSGAARP